MEYYYNSSIKRGEQRMDKIKRHKEICDQLHDIYKKKNEAYGDSFGKTFRELGILSAVTRIYDKINRISALTRGAKNDIMDESLKDTFLDASNYCIMTIIEMEKAEKEKNESNKS
jgi:hypothetical protein